jgi:NAD(P)-dependent dehydrogenase (short-subunit alcohol dehydrogenase family)
MDSASLPLLAVRAPFLSYNHLAAMFVAVLAAPMTPDATKVLALDVTDEQSIQAAFRDLHKATGGRLDLLINNAGAGSLPCPVLDMDLTKARDILETNVWGQLRVCQVFAPLLIETARNARPTTILNIGSIAAPHSFPWRSVYSASKACLHTFSDALRQEVAVGSSCCSCESSRLYSPSM